MSSNEDRTIGMTTGGDSVIGVDLHIGDEEREIGKALLARLVKEYGLGKALSLVVAATEEGFTALLHMESPMWEMNIQSTASVLAILTANVLEHRECAEQINASTTKETVS